MQKNARRESVGMGGDFGAGEAAGGVVATEVAESLDFSTAGFLGDGTARVKGTTGRRMDGGGNIAGQEDALAFGIGIHFGYGGDEGLGVGMFRLVEEVAGFGGFDDFSQVHDHDPAADVFDDSEVVRDEQVGDAVFLLEVLEEVDDLGLDGDIERADGFIADDQFRFDGEGAGDADALALAAAEFVRVTPGVGGIQPDGLQEFGDAFRAGGRKNR